MTDRPDNVIPIDAAAAGRRIARAAIDSAALAARLYNLERSLLVALDRAQRMRRAYEDTGEIHHEGTGEALDRCAVWLAGVRDA